MKIGTYNLGFLFDAGTRLFSGKETEFSTEYVEKRCSYFAQQFDNLNADILFLQEVGNESALVKILNQTKNDYSYFMADPDSNGVGNAVIFKKILEVSCESIPTNGALPTFDREDKDILGPRIQSRRDFIQAKIKVGEDNMTIIGVHIKSNFLMYENGSSNPPETISQLDTADGIIRSEMFRFSQAKKVRQIVDDVLLKDENGRVIVLGDLNSTSSNKVYEIIRGHMKKRPDALVPILDSIEELKRYSLVGKDYNGLIDHVLVSQSLQEIVNEVHIHNEDLFEHTGHPDYPYIIESDHAPITFSV